MIKRLLKVILIAICFSIGMVTGIFEAAFCTIRYIITGKPFYQYPFYMYSAMKLMAW